MKTVIYWIVLFLIFVAGIAAQWQPFRSPPQSLGTWALIFIVGVVPGWIIGSSHLVQVAIENAQRSNFRAVRTLLISRGWLIFPSFRYNEIVTLLGQLSTNPDKKPTFHSEQFSKYIINDGMGYILTYEGKEKMLEKLSSSWLHWNPNYLVILLRVVVAIAVIRGVVFVISLFASR